MRMLAPVLVLEVWKSYLVGDEYINVRFLRDAATYYQHFPHYQLIVRCHYNDQRQIILQSHACIPSGEMICARS